MSPVSGLPVPGVDLVDIGVSSVYGRTGFSHLPPGRDELKVTPPWIPPSSYPLHIRQHIRHLQEAHPREHVDELGLPVAMDPPGVVHTTRG